VKNPGRALLAALAALALHCSPPRPPSEPQLRPLEKRRAAAVIERAVRENGAEPGPARVLDLGNGAEVRAVVMLAAGAYGIVYLDAEEAKKLSRSLPRRNDQSDRLPLARASDGAVLLILYDDAYVFDVGDRHSATVITAENKLTRDVWDFLQHVVKQGKMR
jgi:hypothetical protein